jgi:hypothetical protein
VPRLYRATLSPLDAASASATSGQAGRISPGVIVSNVVADSAASGQRPNRDTESCGGKGDDPTPTPDGCQGWVALLRRGAPGYRRGPRAAPW